MRHESVLLAVLLASCGSAVETVEGEGSIDGTPRSVVASAEVGHYDWGSWYNVRFELDDGGLIHLNFAIGAERRGTTVGASFPDQTLVSSFEAQYCPRACSGDRPDSWTMQEPSGQLTVDNRSVDVDLQFSSLAATGTLVDPPTELGIQAGEIPIIDVTP